MASKHLTVWNNQSFTYSPIPGTEDWAEVALLEDGRGDYEWTEFKAFYSPSARRYFWHGDSGCSCNGWSDDVSTPAGFEDGDRAALLRAWESFTKDHSYDFSTEDYLSGVAEIRNFKEPK
jgi:hypothetical protein